MDLAKAGTSLGLPFKGADLLSIHHTGVLLPTVTMALNLVSVDVHFKPKNHLSILSVLT
jgi:hypothetical protein